jgi:hypothetical protein
VQTEQDAEEKKEAEALKGFQDALKNSRNIWAPVELDGSESPPQGSPSRSDMRGGLWSCPCQR